MVVDDLLDKDVAMMVTFTVGKSVDIDVDINSDINVFRALRVFNSVGRLLKNLGWKLGTIYIMHFMCHFLV